MLAMGTGWTVWGSNPGVDEIYRTRPDRPWVPPSLLYHKYRVFPGVKRSGRGVDHPTLSSAEIQERVELYLYSPFGPSWPVLGWTLPCRQWLSYITTSYFMSALCYLKCRHDSLSGFSQIFFRAWIVVMHFATYLPQFVNEHGIFSRTKILRIHICTEMKPNFVAQ